MNELESLAKSAYIAILEQQLTSCRELITDYEQIIRTGSNLAGWTTVREQMRVLNITYSKKMHWQAGALCREKWVDRYGTLPPKDLKRKTLSKGSHMFAIYPPQFIPVIHAVLNALNRQKQAQGWLF